jgi:hypothetical protein
MLFLLLLLVSLQRDPKENKGQGLGFMFCCCSPKTAEDAEQK